MTHVIKETFEIIFVNEFKEKYAFELDCIASLNMTCERVGLDHNIDCVPARPF